MLPTALSPTATRVRARSSRTPYEERPRMKPTAMTKSTSAAMAAALASCQPKAFPATHRRIAAASTDQPRTLTTDSTGRTRRPQTPSAIRLAGASARRAVLLTSDHTLDGRPWSCILGSRMPDSRAFWLAAP